MKVDKDEIARALGAEYKGKIKAKGGYFGALQLAADVREQFRVPAGGGRATDPAWTERRLVPLAPRTLKRLEELAAKISTQWQVRVEPMQLAGLLLEQTAERLSRADADKFFREQSRG